MEFAEIKERYKLLPPKKRWGAAAGAGVLVVLVAYFSSFDFTVLEEQLTSADAAASEAQTKFETAKNQKANLPQLEEAVAVTEEQLAKAKARLPLSYDIEDTLHKVSTIAKEINVLLPVFVPGNEITGGGASRYAELPISIKICGSYAQIAAFFDRVVHLEQSIKVRNIKMNSVGACETGQAEAPLAVELTGVEGAKEQRRKVKVDTTADLILFRAISSMDAGVAMPEAAGGSPAQGGADQAPPSDPAANQGEQKPVESVRSGVAPPTLGIAPKNKNLKTAARGGNG